LSLVWFIGLLGGPMLPTEASAATLVVPGQYSTVQAALTAAQPGDVVLLYPGVYNERVFTVRGGTPEKRIVLDGQNVATVKRIHLKHDYFTVQNITISGETGTGSSLLYFDTGVDYAIVQNCVIDINSAPYVWGIFFITPTPFPYGYPGELPSNNTITNNEIKNGYGYPMVHIGGQYTNFINNTVKDGRRVESFIRLIGKYNKIQNNVFYNNIFDENVSGHPDSMETFGFSTSGCLGSQYHTIDRNIFCSGTGGIAQFTDSRSPYVNNLTFTNNIFIDAGTSASVTIENTFWYNNVFYENDQAGITLSFACREYTAETSCNGVAGTSCANGTKVYNNVFLNGGSGGALPSRSGYYMFSNSLKNVAADYNYVGKIINGVPYSAVESDPLQQAVGDPGGWDVWRWWEPNGINGGDPGFFAESPGCTYLTCNFELVESSILRGKGYNLHAAGLWTNATDKNGVGRPSSGAWDIGAYQYVDPSGVISPGNLRLKIIEK